jgi:AraC-like DNA-binding protein
MSLAASLNERAAPATGARAALWHVDDGWALFAGPLQHNDPHAHSAAVYLAGLYGTFRLRIAGGDWLSCRSAVIRAGTPYEFDVGGDPLGVFYLEPNLAGVDALAPLLSGASEIGGALVGDADAPLLRAAFEQRPGAGELRQGIGDMVGFAKCKARRQIDARIARAVSDMGRSTDAASVTIAARAAGLSASRFQHLFTREVGVPFRRYRGWQRLRGAIHAAASGLSLTEAAYAAGFADQAHFSRTFRATFGAPPSRGL